MNALRTSLVAAAIVASLGVTTALAADGDSAGRVTEARVTSASTAGTETVVLDDQSGDVAQPKLDIQKVRVVNSKDQLKVRVYLPGVERANDFPTGAISVFLDTDPARRGAEYGHFMDFFSEYRFAEVENWREQVQEGSAGNLASAASLRSDRQHKLRWYEFAVAKDSGLFDAGVVRVAVTTINTGDLEPTVIYDPAVYDHLGAKHAWSGWIPVSR